MLKFRLGKGLQRVVWCALLLPSLAFGAAKPDPAEISRVEKYLNAITTMQADFLQVAPSGELATGKFFLARPGKIRWQYDPPVPLLILVNGSFMVYYDAELDQVSHIPVSSTLATFVARPEIRFSDPELVITDYHKEAGVLRFTLVRAGKEGEGKLTLLFNAEPLSLRKMEVTDATGQTTEVSLSNASFGVQLSENLFELETDKLFRKRKN